MKKMISVLLAAVLVFALCACGGNSNALTGNLKDIVKDVTSSYDFEGVEFYYSGDETASDLLYFSYGFEDDSLLEDYVLCMRGEARAASFVIIRFKEGADPNAIKDTLQTYYVEAMYSLFQLYIPEEYDIAKGAAYKIYDNAVVLAIYDTEGNEGIFSVVDKYAE